MAATINSRTYSDPSPTHPQQFEDTHALALTCAMDFRNTLPMNWRGVEFETLSEGLKISGQCELTQRCFDEAHERIRVGNEIGFNPKEISILLNILRSQEMREIRDPAQFEAALICSYARALFRHRNNASILPRINPVLTQELPKVLKELSKFVIVPLTLELQEDADIQYLQASYEIGEEVSPYIRNFRTDCKHTIPLEAYLNVRISHTIRRVMRLFNTYGRNTEVFIGPIKDLKNYYANLGYRNIIRLGTNNSNKYFALEHESHPHLNKFVIAGISNLARLNNVLLQLKFLGVDLEQSLNVHGTVEAALRENVSELNTVLEALDPKPYLAFVGNRSLVMIELAKRLYPDEMAACNLDDQKAFSIELLEQRNNLQTCEIGGVFKFSYATAEIDGEERGIIGFRMPNGDLAGIATEALLEHGVKRVVLIGAGGSLRSEAGTGTYQLISSASYQNREVVVSKSKFMTLGEMQELRIFPPSASCTVDTPLEEDLAWERKMRTEGKTAVDVEMHHALAALAQSTDDVKYFPGLFTSDVVGEHPLVKKISPSNAYPHFPEFAQACFDSVGVPTC